MSNRGQIVKCGDKVTEMKYVEYGVPQGSILGPLLFILYINDIGTILKKSKYHLFADDTVVYVSGTNVTRLVETLNSELKNLSNWLTANKLKLNVEKTKAMVLSRDKDMGQLDIRIDRQSVEIVSKIKYLGIIVDNTLKFGENVDYVCKKISQKLGVLNRCKKFLSMW